MSEVISPPRVKVTLKFVRNLQNYESLHVELGVEDSKRHDETTNEAVDRVWKFVEAKLIEKVQKVEKDLSE